MSTRGLIGFIRDGQVHAKYIHHDCYPTGLGQNIVDFCDCIDDWAQFINHYDQIEWGEKEVTDSLETTDGAEVLPAILSGKVISLYDEKEFAQNESFCEYAYLINLDTQELEIYSHNLQTAYDQSDKHLPMNLLVKYPLNEIPTHWIEFLKLRSKIVERDFEL